MRAALLRTPIRIEAETVTATDPDYNVETKTWGAWRTVFCHKEPRQARENFDDGQRYAVTLLRLTCRRLDIDGVLATMRVVLIEDGRVFEIQGILPGETDDWTVLDVSSQDNR